MSPLDGLHRINRKSKIYRTSDRLNFLLADNLPQLPQEKNESSEPARIHRPNLQKSYAIKIILTLAVIFLISGAMYLSEKIFNSPNNIFSDFNKYNPFARLSYLLTQSDKRLAGEFDDRVNILLLGVGGEGHDGPFLTDTMIFVSIKPSTGEVGLVSLPRDMVVETKKGQWEKINAVYAGGLSVSPEQGLKNISKVIENITDLPVNYYAVATFDGFKKFIDEIGGITVNVPKSFTDATYPTPDDKTTTVAFNAGSQLMDGSTALVYARSRHGDNYEGSDFARSRRQQLIIEAVKNKMFNFSTLLSPTKLEAIFDLLGGSIKTNLSIWQSLKIASIIKNTTDDKVFRVVLDDGPDSLLTGGISPEGAYILQPKNGNYDQLAEQVKNIFNVSKIRAEGVNIEIQNGTEQGGLAYWTTVALEKLGYKIVSYHNAAMQDYAKTKIYDLTDKNKSNTIKWLKNELQAELAAKTDVPPSSIQDNPNSQSEQADILIILGKDHATRFKLPEEKPINTSTSTADVIINATSTPAAEITTDSANQ